MQSSESVIIKGVREGLLVILDDDVPFPAILTELTQRINANPGFFKGAGVTINSGHRVMDRPEFDVLYRMLTRNSMNVLALVSLSAQSRMVAEGYGVASRPPSFASGDAGGSLGLKGRGASQTAPLGPADSVSEAGMGLFLRCTLRPGQSVRFGGDVCILGDVEPGADIVADGDVIVWGSLRGTVHAGTAGDAEAVVCALEMSPAHLGIAGIVIKFPPAEERYRDSARSPALARIEEGQIVVEAWQRQESQENQDSRQDDRPAE